MITIPDSLVEQLSREFAQACAELVEARRRRLKDTPAHRAAAAEWHTKIDVGWATRLLIAAFASPAVFAVVGNSGLVKPPSHHLSPSGLTNRRKNDGA